MRVVIALVLAGSAAATVIAQDRSQVDPMVQRLAACVDVLSAVASGQLVERPAMTKAFRSAFEAANPGKTLDAMMKIVEKKPEKKDAEKP